MCQALCCDKTRRGPALVGLTVFGGGEPVNPQANRTELWVVIHATEEGLSCSDGVAGGASGRRQSHGKPGTCVPGGRGHRLVGGEGGQKGTVMEIRQDREGGVHGSGRPPGPRLGQGFWPDKKQGR